ncbi:Putative ATPase [Ignavibacterium album JCM 16511]|uniref:Putative ATPase n=1 Tax=Ignavibacterium album (strain DSM 19864 / JCM 16511 / NBRC 101810 / Mat9-16) TaxID=945713 RepID=I0AIS6_IGNAJ|nr:helicase HerA-like domain-containing protein [Ignavibacterium album]AFH48883.1 Putative ATPase [Ignavibacterium album JCM 16511]
MTTKEKFIETIQQGYSFKGDSIIFGTAIFDSEAIPNLHIKMPLATINRHGLIAGATGTGKTKTVQLFAEALSDKSIPVLLMDIKGDLSGIAAEGISNPKISERHNKIGLPYQPKKFPVEFLTLSDEKGVRLRATVSEFGPILISKILELNDVQSGLVSVLFKYCDDNNLPLLDLKDFKKILQYASNDGKQEIEKEYGNISTTSMGTILRKVIELEQQGANKFFGERSFDVEDLLRLDENGNGMISVLRLIDLQNRPKLFSTFMLCLLAEIYQTFPELGDRPEPKFVIVIDEAHLIFNEASKALLEQIETIIKLIRSKGVGIYFCTQNPQDVPASVLSQLGLKIQHALRAFTAQDRKMIKLTAENYPLSEFYKTDEMLTSLGIGEAAITVLNEKGIPTPLAATLLCAPRSRMDVLTDDELNEIISKSKLIPKYNEIIDRESAYEILNQKLERAAQQASNEISKEVPQVRFPQQTKTTTRRTEKSAAEKIASSPLAKQVGRTLVRELTRGIFGVLLGGKKR